MENENSSKFKQLCEALRIVRYKDNAGYIQTLQHLIDGFTELDYTHKICDEQTAANIIKHLCYLVPPNHDQLVSSLSILVFNLVSRQEIILEHHLETVVDYLIKALHSTSRTTCNAVLRALGSVLYENGSRLQTRAEVLVGDQGVLRQIVKSSNEELLRSAVQCVENMCIRVVGHPYLTTESQSWCLSIFIHVLQMPKSSKVDDIGYCKAMVSALRGLQHMFVTSKTCPQNQLGPLLAIIRTYMLFGLVGAPQAVGTCLYPMPLGQTTVGAKPTADSSDVSLRPGGTTGSEKPKDDGGGSSKKNRKKRGAKKGKQEKSEKSTNQTIEQSMDGLHMQATCGYTETTRRPVADDALSLYPAWSKASSSDSEFSDTDGSGATRSRSLYSRVRQTALGCFHAVIKACEKRVMFGYWSSFLPSTPGQGTSSAVFTVVIKDPSAKVRTGALAVLTALLEGSKQYLQAAEDSEQYRTAPFTPFSVTLGYMIKEIHRCLMLSLTSEQSALATTQIIKCLATLIPCVPYHRLRPGLLTRVVKQIKPCMSHRDPNIRVACLSCLGAMLTVQAPMLEVNYILQATRANTRTSESSHTQVQPELTYPDGDTNNHESGYHSNHSNLSTSVGSTDGASELLNTSLNLGQSFNLTPGFSPLGPSGIPTPQLSSGNQTPSLTDVMGNSHTGASGGMSWLIKLCVKNTAPHLLEKREDADLPSRIVAESSPARVPARTDSTRYVQPLPVRLESLQVLTSMCKGYFKFIRQVLSLIGEVVQCCVEDADVSVQLHGAKLLDELGTVMAHRLQDNTRDSSAEITCDSSAEIPRDSSAEITRTQVLEFWVRLLNGPVPNTLQTTPCNTVRAMLCDCLSTISAPVFDQLPTDKHILCMTLILGMTSDEDHHVRASAIRTLGVYAFIPCLRRDVAFIADSANAIISATEESLLSVKVKAMWSLGNLTDALATIKESEEDASFTEEFSDMLVFKLFEVATRGALDTERVRSNAVRALGNLLRYLPQRCLESSRFSGTVLSNGVKALVKNVTSGLMKVRWNACYAIGNMLKNSLLPFAQMPWMDSVLDALQLAVKECKNFKVRINAALSLSIPTRRTTYGSCDMYLKVWGGLVECLHNSETTTDLAEFKYSEALNQQVVATLVHLVGHVECTDLTRLHPLLAHDTQFLASHVQRYHGKAAHTAATGLEQATARVTQLHDECKESAQIECLHALTLIFIHSKDKDSNPERPTSPLQSAFKQTYD